VCVCVLHYLISLAPPPDAIFAGTAAAAVAEAPKKEVLECVHTAHIDFGLWVHTDTRFFRRKALVFNEIGVQIDLPKSVAMLKAPMALRVVRTYVDHALPVLCLVETQSADILIMHTGRTITSRLDRLTWTRSVLEVCSYCTSSTCRHLPRH